MLSSPLEQFSILKVIDLDLVFLDLSITSISIYSFLTLIGLSTLCRFVSEKNYFLFRSWVFIVNSTFKLILNLLINNLGRFGIRYINLILTIFLVILVFNYLSLVPYSFTLTAHLATCLTLSITVWLGATVLGFYLNGLKFLAMFLPFNSPASLVVPFILIETLGYLVRPISLGVRLAANLAAGRLLLALGSSFIYFLFSSSYITINLISILPLALLIAFSYLEFAVALIQTYVFSLLSISYIHDAISPR